MVFVAVLTIKYYPSLLGFPSWTSSIGPSPPLVPASFRGFVPPSSPRAPPRPASHHRGEGLFNSGTGTPGTPGTPGVSRSPVIGSSGTTLEKSRFFLSPERENFSDAPLSPRSQNSEFRESARQKPEDSFFLSPCETQHVTEEHEEVNLMVKSAPARKFPMTPISEPQNSSGKKSPIALS